MERWLSGLKRMFGEHVGYCPPGFESLPLRHLINFAEQNLNVAETFKFMK